MIAVMPVPLLVAHPRECSPQGHIRYVPAVCACRRTCPGIHIDRLDKLSEGIGVSSVRRCSSLPAEQTALYSLPAVPVHEFAVADLDLGFEVFLLFLGVVLAHHGKALIIQLTGYIVLVNADEKVLNSPIRFSACASRF